MRHAANIDHTCQTHERVIYCIWMSLSWMNATCLTLKKKMSHAPQMKVMKNIPQAHPSCSSSVCTFAFVHVWMCSILLYVFEIPPQAVYRWVLLCLVFKLQCDAACCSVIQCDAVWCSVLQCDAVCCSVLQCDAVWCGVMQCVAVCCSVCCNVLQRAAMCCSAWAIQQSVWRYKFSKFSSLQHAATLCNTLPHTTISLQVESLQSQLATTRTTMHVLRCIAVCCSVMQYVAVCCSELQCVKKSARYKMLYTPECIVCTATHCTTLQHAATQCSKMQHIMGQLATLCTKCTI